MHKLPTDQQIMQCIFEMYAQEYPHPKGAPKTERARVYVPIDVAAVAAKLRCDAELTFGRLYYHLDTKHGYSQDDGAKVHLFALKVGNERHCVNYPYLAALLAEKKLKHWRFWLTLTVSVVVLIVSVAAIVAQIATAK